MILPHHQRVIDRLIDLFQDDPRFPAMIVGGSVAKGRAQPDSDVDVMLIATNSARAVPWLPGSAARARPPSGGIPGVDVVPCSYLSNGHTQIGISPASCVLLELASKRSRHAYQKALGGAEH
jgi:hypothetical protein